MGFLTKSLFIFFSYLISESPEQQGNTLHVVEGKNVYNMVVEADKKFVIRLNGNPTTGHLWFLETNETQLNSMNIKCIKDDNEECGKFIPPKHTNGMVGVGGVFEYTFIAEPTTEINSLNFVYKAPWSDEAIRKVTVWIQTKYEPPLHPTPMNPVPIPPIIGGTPKAEEDTFKHEDENLEETKTESKKAE